MRPPRSIRDESGLVHHGALLMAGTLLGSMCNAGFHMAVGRTLPPAEYGSLVAMLGIILAATTPMLAVQNTLAHYASKLILEGRRDDLPGLFRHWALRFAVLSAAVGAGAVVFRQPLSVFWGGVEPALIVCTFGVLAGSLWIYLFYGLLQGVQAFAWLAFVPQAWGGVRLALGWGLTVWVSATALAALSAQGAGVLAVAVLSLWAMRRMRLPDARRAFRRTSGTYRYLGSSLVCLAGYAMLMNLDTALAKRYFDAETAGLFAKAATIARTAVFLPVPIATALFPKVTSAGEMTEASWRLLGRALLLAGGILAAVAAGCCLLPQLPWTILYGRWAPEEAAMAVALTRAMVLAMTPLALVYLLLNFEMAQRRFRWAYGLVPCSLGYVAWVALRHDTPLRIPFALGMCSLAALVLLGLALGRQRRTAPGG